MQHSNQHVLWRRGFGFLLSAIVCVAANSGIPLPSVSGPIPVTPSSRPLLEADRTQPAVDLVSKGYIEQEYFLSGNANIYEFDPYGNLAVKVPNAKYTDRILLRRPKDGQKFSGSVIVEILNPAFGYDVAPFWDYSHAYFMAHGDAWVGVTSKPNTAETLKKFNPTRYAPLSWPGQACAGSPAKPEYGALWDILSQASALLKSQSASNPLAGLSVQKVYLVGKSGGDAPAYLISIHPTASLNFGKAIFDGYVINSSFGSGQIALNQCAPRSGLVRTTPPRGVPVINVQSETDVVHLNGGWQNRRPDSDASPDLYRLYEVPGSSHIDAEINAPPIGEDLAIFSGRMPAEEDCAEKAPLNPFPLHYVVDAAFAHLEDWTRRGIPPPKADRIAINISGNPPTATSIKDQFGNTTGGVRTPFLDVPTATYIPVKTGGNSCRYTGYAVPFDQARLRALYPTHQDFVAKVRDDVDELLKQRWLTPDDANEIKAQAGRAAVP